MKIKKSDLASDAMMYYPFMPSSYFDENFKKKGEI